MLFVSRADLDNLKKAITECDLRDQAATKPGLRPTDDMLEAAALHALSVLVSTELQRADVVWPSDVQAISMVDGKSVPLFIPPKL